MNNCRLKLTKRSVLWKIFLILVRHWSRFGGWTQKFIEAIKINRRRKIAKSITVQNMGETTRQWAVEPNENIFCKRISSNITMSGDRGYAYACESEAIEVESMS
jgi:hypothetical protein